MDVGVGECEPPCCCCVISKYDTFLPFLLVLSLTSLSQQSILTTNPPATTALIFLERKITQQFRRYRSSTPGGPHNVSNPFLRHDTTPSQHFCRGSTHSRTKTYGHPTTLPTFPNGSPPPYSEPDSRSLHTTQQLQAGLQAQQLTQRYLEAALKRSEKRNKILEHQSRRSPYVKRRPPGEPIDRDLTFPSARRPRQDVPPVSNHHHPPTLSPTARYLLSTPYSGSPERKELDEMWLASEEARRLVAFHQHRCSDGCECLGDIVHASTVG